MVPSERSLTRQPDLETGNTSETINDFVCAANVL
jgi:hypothetical protein